MRAIDLLVWLPCALGGAALGLFYFGGLWWTVRAIVGSRRSVFLQLASLLLRTAATLIGFYMVGGGDARRLVACLAGFVLARMFVARRVRTSAMPSPSREVQRATRP
jgi:F1F0 ATPase subunit 2